MLRGINRQNVFEDDEDRLFFMRTLAQYKKISGFRLYAFVLMSNHIHMLIEPAGEPLDVIFRRIGTRYAGWYNRKYQRTGHLFQDRFKSENVENDLYFITVLRYILQNPMKAGIESRPGVYRWSSYLAYEKGGGTITDTQYALEFFNSRDELMEYLLRNNDDVVMDEASFDRRMKEDLAKEKMQRITGCSSVAAFQQYDLTQQKEYAKLMYHEGLSMGQIARLCGMSKSTVYKAIKASADLSDDLSEPVMHEESTFDYYSDTGTIW